MNGVVLPAIRGYLLHISHYDPVWVARKEHEQPFDLKVGLAVVEAMAHEGLNLLIVDPKDGVAYASHPELKRHYTQPMEVLAKLTDRARELGIEVAIKLNFSQSGTHRHNHWFAPHHDLFDNDEYWERAFRIVDELIAVARPERFFHIGMDEDHDRTTAQYVAAIERLHTGLTERQLRTVIWNDSACHWPRAAVHREKSMAAERKSPADIVHVIWDYSETPDEAAFERCRHLGLTVWGAPGTTEASITGMLETLHRVGGEGILLTRWTPCIEANRELLLERVRSLPK